MKNPRSRVSAEPRAGRRWLAAMLLAALVLPFVPAGSRAAAPPPDMAGWQERETDWVRFVIQENDRISPDAFVATYGDAAERAVSELSSVFGVEAPEKVTFYVYADAGAFAAAAAATGRNELPGLDAIADPPAADVSINLLPFRARTPLEAENALRHAVAHIMTGAASGYKIPRGFDEGIAQYVERPVNPKLLGIAADVQDAYQRGALLSWSDLNRPQPLVNQPDLIAAEAYSVAAFLVSRYRLPMFQDFLVALETAPDWREALRTTYGREPEDMEKQWRENLPRWAAADWKDNLIAGFDLGPARDLLAQGNYASAKRVLERSQQLFSEIDDAERLAEVERLMTQCDTGIQAEALMAQVQQALELHTYDRAASLLAQAKTQYDLLPAEQRPDEVIATYEALSAAGIQAGFDLDEAVQRSRRWGDYPEARDAALAAGASYARLGDTEMTNQTQTLLSDLDSRQQRIVMMLGALAALSFAWLGLWLWARGPSEIDWD